MQFFQSRSFPKQNGPTRNFFGSVRRKSFERKSWYPLPIHKIFGQKNFSEKWRVLLRKLSVLWENQFSTKSWYTIFCIFLIRNFSDTKEPPYEPFWYCETKNFRHKIVIPLFCIKSFDTRKFLKPRVVPLRNFPALWEKKFSTVNNDNPLLSFKISDTRNFLKDWESPYECFLYCEKNNFRQNRDTPSYAIFLVQKFSETKESPYDFLRYWDKKFPEKIVTSPSYW